LAKTAHGSSRVASLFARSPAPCCFPLVCIPSSGSLVAGNTQPAPGPFGKPVALTPAVCGREAVGSPKFPSYPCECMPCPHQTPVVPFLTCHVVRRSAAFRQVKSVGFPSLGWEDYPYGPRPTIFRGSISRPALSLHPAPNTPLLECTRVRYGPVGSTLVRSDLPWSYAAHRLGNINEFQTLLSSSPHFGFILARSPRW
jgi:hypothetical protein